MMGSTQNRREVVAIGVSVLHKGEKADGDGEESVENGNSPRDQE